jgi:hypothetical protein
MRLDLPHAVQVDPAVDLDMAALQLAAKVRLDAVTGRPPGQIRTACRTASGGSG